MSAGESNWVKVAGAGVAAAAVALILAGTGRMRTVYEPGTGEFVSDTATNLPDRQLVVDATFSGVKRNGGRLESTYDRHAPPGKRACPT